ncbi:MAG: 3'-5' exoribonuclease YhaM family protein [Candidatus Saccharibacteria bacterium]
MKQYITDLKEGQSVNSPFVLKEKRLIDYREKAGKYLMLTLSDSTGDIGAVVWDNAEALAEDCTAGRVIMVMGEVGSFRDNPQIRVSHLWPAAASDYEPGDFVASSTRPVAEMQGELEGLVETMTAGPLKDLTRIFITSSAYEKFCQAPAAMIHHHNYTGGLLEHTLSVMRLCDRIASAYEHLDRDLLLWGALFHDIGKLQEMEFVPGIQYTEEGSMLGHIVIGVQMVDEMIRQLPGFAPELKTKLLHLIVSHHGEYEWQSPKKPQFTEAKVLHLADMMDAEIFKFTRDATNGVKRR